MWPAAFSQALAGYRLLPDALTAPVVPRIPLAEAIGAAALFPDTRTAGAIGSCCSGFAAAIAINLLRGHTTSTAVVPASRRRARMLPRGIGWLHVGRVLLLAAGRDRARRAGARAVVVRLPDAVLLRVLIVCALLTVDVLLAKPAPFPPEEFMMQNRFSPFPPRCWWPSSRSARSVALVRQIGILQRIMPAGALMIDKGPVGAIAPTFELTDIRGAQVKVGGFDASGKATLLFFLSPTPCLKLLPLLPSLQASEATPVNIARERRRCRRTHALRTSTTSGASVRCCRRSRLAYQIGKLPYAVLLDETGTVRAKGRQHARASREPVRSEGARRRIAAAVRARRSWPRPRRARARMTGRPSFNVKENNDMGLFDSWFEAGAASRSTVRGAARWRSSARCWWIGDAAAARRSHRVCGDAASGASAASGGAATAASDDPMSCDYWKYCAIDGWSKLLRRHVEVAHRARRLRRSRGSARAAIRTSSDYIVSYNDCCGKTSCGKCFCNRNEREKLPVQAVAEQRHQLVHGQRKFELSLFGFGSAGSGKTMKGSKQGSSPSMHDGRRPCASASPARRKPCITRPARAVRRAMRGATGGRQGAGRPRAAADRVSGQKYASETGRAQLVATLLHGMFGEIKVRDKHHNFKMRRLRARAMTTSRTCSTTSCSISTRSMVTRSRSRQPISVRRARRRWMARSVHAQREVVIKGLGLTLRARPVGDAAAPRGCAIVVARQRVASAVVVADAGRSSRRLTTAPAHADGAGRRALGSTGAQLHGLPHGDRRHPGKVPPLANLLGYFTHLPAGREYVMRPARRTRRCRRISPTCSTGYSPP